jgi:hypothetical protein
MRDRYTGTGTVPVYPPAGRCEKKGDYQDHVQLKGNYIKKNVWDENTPVAVNLSQSTSMRNEG